MEMRRADVRERGCISLKDLKGGEWFEWVGGAVSGIAVMLDGGAQERVKNYDLVAVRAEHGVLLFGSELQYEYIYRIRIISVDEDGTLVWERVTG